MNLAISPWLTWRKPLLSMISFARESNLHYSDMRPTPTTTTKEKAVAIVGVEEAAADAVDVEDEEARVLLRCRTMCFTETINATYASRWDILRETAPTRPLKGPLLQPLTLGTACRPRQLGSPP
jgi:hypothetical protein